MGYIIETYPDGAFEVEVSDPSTGETRALVVARPGELERADPEAGQLTDPRALFEVRDPAPLRMLEDDSKGGVDPLAVWRKAGLTVRVARGRKMRTVDGLFDEFAAALQFPYYFGENWPAFNECLEDMDWLPMNVGIVIVIREPGEVLAAEPDVVLSILVRAIVRAAKTYAEPIETGNWWDRPAVPFHVVLQASPADAAAIRARWLAAGAQVSDLIS